MKVYRVFYPKGNMLNRQYKAQRNASYLLQGTGILQSLYEGLGYIMFGKTFNSANAILGMSNITLGMSLQNSAQNILHEYLTILERAKNINFIRTIRQRHTNTAADKAMKLLTVG